MEILNVIYLRQLNGTWFIEFEDCAVLASGSQISSLFVKRAPFVSGGYWDDITLAGLLGPTDGAVLVMGGGIGSFLPLHQSLCPATSVTLVESNEDILGIGRRLQRDCLNSGSDRIHWRFGKAEDYLAAGLDIYTSIFIDLYDGLGIDSFALSGMLHRSLSDGVKPHVPILINVHVPVHTDFPSFSREITAYLRGYYGSVVILKRATSITIACTVKADPESLVKSLRAQQCAYPGIWGELELLNYDKGKRPVMAKIEEDFAVSGLKFSILKVDPEPLSFSRIEKGVLLKILARLKGLDPIDLARLARRQTRDHKKLGPVAK